MTLAPGQTATVKVTLADTITGRTCTGGTQPLPGATVQVSDARGTSAVTTDAQGKYSLWVDTTRNPFTVIATQPGWQTNGARVQAKTQATTTQDLTLNQACG